MDIEKLVADIRATESDDDAAQLLTEAVEQSEAGLKANRDKVLGELKQLKKSYGDVSPEDIEQMRAQIEELEEAQGKAANADELVKRTEAKYQRELEKLQGKLQQSEGEITTLLRDRGLTDALAKAGVTEKGLEYARAYFAPKVEIESDGEGRTATIDGRPLHEAVADWAKSEDAKMFLRANANTGGGASGGTGGTSGAKQMARVEFEKLTPQDQMEFIRDGGQLADQ